MTIDDQIRHEKLQYDAIKEAGKTSASMNILQEKKFYNLIKNK